MKKWWNDKKGVTILEGLIAMTLLALVATGTFAVLLSASRTSSQPDLREEMVLAMERASQKLQVYVYPEGMTLDSEITDNIGEGLCPGEDSADPRAEGRHSINCLLPPICDKNNSSFSYILIRNESGYTPRAVDRMVRKNEDGSFVDSGIIDFSSRDPYFLIFEISCNGFTL